MRYIDSIPQNADDRAKARKSLVRKRKALTGLCFACALVAIVLLLGTLGALLAAEFANVAPQTKTLLYILTGVFLGGAVAFALLAVLFSKTAQTALLRELDFIERCDGENSFFVGEGTLATFGNGKLTLHEEAGGKVIFVPYAEMRFFSVCTRHAPKDKGEWSVVIEMPARYIAKNKADKGAPPALVQTDYKPRLYECIGREGLELIGEVPAESKREKKQYECIKKFVRPDSPKRKRAAVMIAAGAVLLAASFPVAFLWEATVGAVAGVVGAFLLGRSVYSFLKAKSVLALYREGLWWKESARNDSVFLLWNEVEGCGVEDCGGRELLAVRCAYGAYHFPVFEGAQEEIAALTEKSAQQGAPLNSAAQE